MAERYNPGRFVGLVPNSLQTKYRHEKPKRQKSRFVEKPFPFEEKSEFQGKLDSVYQVDSSQISSTVTPLKILQALRRQEF